MVLQKFMVPCPINNPAQTGSGDRFVGVDCLRLLLSFMVVAIHAPFPGAYNNIVRLFCCAAVPGFLMISGYFFEKKDSQGKYRIDETKKKRFISKLWKIYIPALLFYSVWFSIHRIIIGKSLPEYWLNQISDFKWIRFVLLHTWHLWYISAAIMSIYVIGWYFKKYEFSYFTILIAGALFSASVFLGRYSIVSIGMDVQIWYSTNFLTLGIPFFVFGMFLRRLDLSIIRKRISQYVLIMLCLLFTMTSLLEQYLLDSRIAKDGDSYFSTVFLAIALFLLFFSYSGNHRIMTFLAGLGKKYSAGIYVWHIFILTFVDFALIRISKNLYEFRPLFIWIVSILFLVMIDRIKILFQSKQMVPQLTTPDHLQ